MGARASACGPARHKRRGEEWSRQEEVGAGEDGYGGGACRERRRRGDGGGEDGENTWRGTVQPIYFFRSKRRGPVYNAVGGGQDTRTGGARGLTKLLPALSSHR